MFLLFQPPPKESEPSTHSEMEVTLEHSWGYLKAPGGRKEMGEECYVTLSIYCSLQTDLEVLLKPRGGLVSVQVARILGQKATEITLHEKKKNQ